MYVFWPGKPFYAEFPMHSLTTGGAADADSLPTAAVARNGAADGAVAAVVTHPAAGWYGVGFTVPAGYATTDAVTVRVTAVIGGVTVHLAVNAYCPVPPAVAGRTFDQYMRSLCADTFGTTSVSGNQVVYNAADGATAHTMVYANTDGVRIQAVFPP